jgi:Co/Zn/Cd efflux system component
MRISLAQSARLSSVTVTASPICIWQLGPGHHAAIIALASVEPRRPSHYKALLAEIHGLSHVTIEVEPDRADWYVQADIRAEKS